jgi:hypothetical protein
LSESTDLEAVAVPSELAEFSRGELEQEELVLPMVQLTQQLSGAVTDGEVDSGHYYNALTGEDYGDAIALVVVHYYKGRFLEQDGKTFVAHGPTAPSNWPEEYAGQEFTSIPDAEETFREDANNNVREWGSGPPIRTTYNYVGFRPEEPDVPIRLSLMRTSAPAAKKINTLLRFEAQNWDRVIDLKAEERSDKRGRQFFVHTIKRGRPTQSEERQKAIDFALAIQRAGGGTPVGDEAEATQTKPAPAQAEGSLDV